MSSCRATNAKAIVRIDAPAGTPPVFIGTAGEVWRWLDETKEVEQ